MQRNIEKIYRFFCNLALLYGRIVHIFIPTALSSGTEEGLQTGKIGYKKQLVSSQILRPCFGSIFRHRFKTYIVIRSRSRLLLARLHGPSAVGEQL